MWRKVMVMGTSIVAGGLIFGAGVAGAQPFPMAGASQPPPDTATSTTPNPDLPNSDPSLLASPNCNPIWYGCQSEATPWDHPNSGWGNSNPPTIFIR